MIISFRVHDRTYQLSDEHSASSYGIPVLVTEDGEQLGPADIVRYSDTASWTAKAIAELLIPSAYQDAASRGRTWERLSPVTVDGETAVVVDGNPPAIVREAVLRFMAIAR